MALAVGCAYRLPPAPDPGVQVDAALRGKAEAFTKAIEERHLSPEGVLLYRVRLDRIAEQLRTGDYPDIADAPTFTGLLAATACTQADVTTGSEQRAALALAGTALRGMDALMAVTGVEGLLARGLRKGPIPDDDDPSHRWFRGANEMAGYAWRGDVSMDQYANGLLPAVFECRRHFPDQAREAITAVARGLLERDLQLIDPDGRRTRFGDLSPSAGLGLGFNSIAKLTGYAVFALAAELDPDPRWAAMRDRLRDDEGVVRSSQITNLRVLGITNYSNDLMAFDLYRVLVPLARQTGDPALSDLEQGLDRAWRRVMPDRNAYFTAVYCQLRRIVCSESLRAWLVSDLARFPLEKRSMPFAPALGDVPRTWLPGRKWRERAAERVPIELRPQSSLEWKSSPYRVSNGVDPNVEYTGLDYLMAYWLDRRNRDRLAER